MIILQEFFKDSLFVAMQDAEGALKMPEMISLGDAEEYNEKQYGIFVSVNGFRHRRIAANLTRINAWAIDIDDGTKAEQQKRLEASPLIPSLVIESKNGFHAYWKAKDATVSNFATVQNILIPFFKADPNAKDLCRILRYPGFFHWKNPNDPFLVSITHEENYSYSESEMLKAFHFFKNEKSKRMQILTATQMIQYSMGELEDLKKFDGSDCAISAETALLKFSGTQYVNGETYDLKINHNGTLQIWVNGKSTANWIDASGRIGSHDRGGPTIFQWLFWIHRDYGIVKKIMKEVFDV